MNLKRFSVMLLSSGMSFGVLAAQSKPLPPKPEDQRPDDVICTFETPMGSHIKRKVCATRQARDDARNANQEDLERVKRGSGKPKTNQ